MPHRLKRDRRMPMMRRGDDAGVHVLVVEHVFEAGRALRGGRLEPVDEPGRLLDLRGVDVAEPGEGDRLVAAHQPLDVTPHDAAATDDPHADRRRLVRGEPMNGPECRSGREQGRGLRGSLDEQAPGWIGIHPTLRGGRMSAREVRTDDRTIHTRGTDRLATPVQRLFNRSGVLNDTGRGRARQRCRSGVDGQPADLGHCRLLGEVVPQGVVDGFLATVEACHVGDFVHLGLDFGEAGTKFVTVIRHAYGSNAGFWDSPHNHFCEARGRFAPRGRPGVLGVDPRPRAARLARRGPRDGDQRDHGRTPLTDRKARGEAATTGRAPAPRSMPMASWAEATESVDSSTRMRPDFPLRVRAGRPAPVPAGLAQETHGFLMADQLGVEQLIWRVQERPPFPFGRRERVRGRLHKHGERAATQLPDARHISFNCFVAIPIGRSSGMPAHVSNVVSRSP